MANNILIQDGDDAVLLFSDNVATTGERTVTRATARRTGGRRGFRITGLAPLTQEATVGTTGEFIIEDV